MTKLENCSQEEFESSINNFYVGCSKTQDRKQKREETIESMQVERTRVLNDKWVEMHFQKPFCEKLEKNYHHWVTVKRGKTDEIVLRMEEDQGEVIKYIHKYRDDVTNEMKYCVAKVKTGGRQRSNMAYNIFKQKDVDIDWIYELCKDQESL